MSWRGQSLPPTRVELTCSDLPSGREVCQAFVAMDANKKREKCITIFVGHFPNHFEGLKRVEEPRKSLNYNNKDQGMKNPMKCSHCNGPNHNMERWFKVHT